MSANNTRAASPAKPSPLGSPAGFASVVRRTAHLNDSMFKLPELMQLHHVFQQRGALNEKQFVGHFHAILETNAWSPTHISQLFMKIDANSDGSVDWDEFTNFMFVHSQSAHDAAAQLASVAFVVPQDENLPLPPGAACGHFVSSSLDGTIKTWNAGWTPLASFRALGKTTSNCVTAMAYLQASGKIALASLHGGVQFFDLVSADKTAQSHVPSGALHHATPLALCAMVDDDTGQDVLYIGDDVGGVTKIAFDATWHLCDGDCPDHVTVTMQGCAVARHDRHTDHVTRLAFVTDLNSVVSASRDGSVKVMSNFRVWDVRQLKCLQTIHDATHDNRHTKLIYFDQASKHLVTCSSTVNQWPIHHAAGPSETLQPHEAPIIKVLFNPSFLQLVTMDAHGHIVLWNVLDGSVISHFYMANTTITAAALDDTGRRLITGSNVGTQVTIWNFSNGSRLTTLYKRRHQYALAPSTPLDRVARAAAAPTMHTQPPPSRKSAPQANEVTGVALITVSVAHSSGRGFTQAKYILSVGWDRRVYVWRDSLDQAYVNRMPEDLSVGHTDDILTVSFCAQKFIATGGMDGCGASRISISALWLPQPRIETLLYPRKLGLLIVVTSSSSVSWLNPRFSLHHATVDLAATLHADIRVAKVDTDGMLVILALASGEVVVMQASDPQQEPAMTLRQLHRWKAYEPDQDITAMEYIETSDVVDTFVVTSSQVSIKLWTLGGVLVGLFGGSTWHLHDALLMSFKAPSRGDNAKAIDTYKREVSGLATRGPPAVDDVWTHHDIHGTLVDVLTLTSISRNKGVLEGLDNAGNVVEVAFHDLYDIQEDYATWSRHEFLTTLVGRVWQEHSWAIPFKAIRAHFNKSGVWQLVDTANNMHSLPSEDACKQMNYRPFRSLALHRLVGQAQPPFAHAVQPTGYLTFLEGHNKATPVTKATTDPLQHTPPLLFSPSKFKDSPNHTRATRPLVVPDVRTSPTKLSSECRALRLPQVASSLSPTKESTTGSPSPSCWSPQRQAASPRHPPPNRRDERKIHALQAARGPPDVPLSKKWDFYLPEVDKY
ncbi:hypothetical protein DYB26_003640 [Aphanomyces astaci]|uniref:EF-hand domain-containing protein n=1 Tax=Aphanomyces astaci TaxID=112090 RepID=A0A397BCE4_APHAT|nr:hypothetical protein DYB36_005842 [Aphanomyces astaci]RHZ10528.1 hypothetical protein DYB26_003640 [Aphanomyces astaci]